MADLKIPIKKPTKSEAVLFEKLVAMVQLPYFF